MSNQPWWGPQEAELSQGDLLSDVPFGYVLNPLTSLGKTTIKHGQTAWLEQSAISDHFLAKGKLAHCLVLSHSCELDKRESVGRVLVAPVQTLDRLPEADRSPVFNQNRLSRLALPGVPGLGDCCADLRMMLAVFRTHCARASKVAFMSEAARERLQAQLIAFFCRTDTFARVPPA